MTILLGRRKSHPWSESAPPRFSTFQTDRLFGQPQASGSPADRTTGKCGGVNAAGKVCLGGRVEEI
jgi:hypothetical protein